MSDMINSKKVYDTGFLDWLNLQTQSVRLTKNDVFIVILTAQNDSVHWRTMKLLLDTQVDLQNFR